MSFYNKNKLTIAGTVGVVVGGGGIAMLIAGIVQMAKGYCDGSNSWNSDNRNGYWACYDSWGYRVSCGYSSGKCQGAKALIGIGVCLIVFAVVYLGATWAQHKREQAQGAGAATPMYTYNAPGPASTTTTYMYAPPPGAPPPPPPGWPPAPGAYYGAPADGVQMSAYPPMSQYTSEPVQGVPVQPQPPAAGAPGPSQPNAYYAPPGPYTPPWQKQ